MYNLGNFTKEYVKQHNPYCPEVSDHPYRILIVGGC